MAVRPVCLGKIIMGSYTEFKSRRAVARCSNEAFFRFVTDMRNFDRFAGGSLAEWMAESSKCSFSISPAGKVSVEITSSEPSSKVQYAATTMLTGTIKIDGDIEAIDDSSSAVRVTIGLELSPFLRMMVAPQAEEYLEKLASAIEGFDEYN